MVKWTAMAGIKFGDWERKCVIEWYQVTREIEKAISRRQARDEDD